MFLSLFTGTCTFPLFFFHCFLLDSLKIILYSQLDLVFILAAVRIIHVHVYSKKGWRSTSMCCFMLYKFAWYIYMHVYLVHSRYCFEVLCIITWWFVYVLCMFWPTFACPSLWTCKQQEVSFLLVFVFFFTCSKHSCKLLYYYYYYYI